MPECRNVFAESICSIPTIVRESCIMGAENEKTKWIGKVSVGEMPPNHIGLYDVFP